MAFLEKVPQEHVQDGELSGSPDKLLTSRFVNVCFRSIKQEGMKAALAKLHGQVVEARSIQCLLLVLMNKGQCICWPSASHVRVYQREIFRALEVSRKRAAEDSSHIGPLKKKRVRSRISHNS